MKPTVDIVEELLNGFNPKLKITDVVDNLDGTATITLCRTLNLREGLSFTINSYLYIVKTISENDITYETTSIPLKGEFVVPKKPKYFHGTPMITNNDLSRIQFSEDKAPLVYLIELIEDEFDNNKLSAIDRNSTIRLFFLDEANFADWDNDEHYALNIIPQANYAMEFRDYLLNHPLLGKIEGTTKLKYHPKFGLTVTQNGTTKNLFNEQFSGVDFTITLPITKDLTLCTC